MIENEDLKKQIQPENALKEMLVNYVGNNNSSVIGDQVTLENIVETLGEEFPEFLLAVAEENWIRGYHQALYDSDLGKKILDEQNQEMYKQNVELAKGFNEAKASVIENLDE